MTIIPYNEFKERVKLRLQVGDRPDALVDALGFLVRERGRLDAVQPETDEAAGTITKEKTFLTRKTNELAEQLFGERKRRVTLNTKPFQGYFNQTRENAANIDTLLSRTSDYNVRLQNIEQDIKGLKEQKSEISPELPPDLGDRLNRIESTEGNLSTTMATFMSALNAYNKKLEKRFEQMREEDENFKQQMMDVYLTEMERARSGREGREKTEDTALSPELFLEEPLAKQIEKEPKPLKRKKPFKITVKMLPPKRGKEEEIIMPKELGEFEAAPDYLRIRRDPYKKTALDIVTATLTNPLLSITAPGQQYVVRHAFIDIPGIRERYDSDKRFAQEVIETNRITYKQKLLADLSEDMRKAIFNTFKDYKQPLLDAIDPKIGYDILSKVKLGGEPLLALDIKKTEKNAVKKMMARAALMQEPIHLEDIIEPNN